MKIIKDIKKAIWKLTWRKKLCCDCSYNYAIGNNVPCWECIEGSEFEKFHGFGVEDDRPYKPSLVVNHRGYTAVMDPYCYHIIITKDGEFIVHMSCTAESTEEELRHIIDCRIKLLEERRDKNGIQKDSAICPITITVDGNAQ